MVSDFFVFYFKQALQFLKRGLDNNGIAFMTETNLHITGGGKKGVPAIIVYNFSEPSAKNV
jgi:hypothetical protein